MLLFFFFFMYWVPISASVIVLFCWFNHDKTQSDKTWYVILPLKSWYITWCVIVSFRTWYKFWYFSKHVLTEDVLSRRIEGQKLVSLRILTKTNKIPKWGERFVGHNKNILIIEESVVDPKEKTFTTYTRNVGLQKVMVR